MPEQLTFAAGLDANTPADKLPDGFIQSGSNIDFSLEAGAARVRRGTVMQASIGAAVRGLVRHYTDPGLGASPYYAFTPTTVYRSTDGVAYSSIATGLQATDDFASTNHKNFTYIASGTTFIKDDSTTTYEWAAQSPTTAPTIVLETLTGITVTSTWSVAEGTGTTASGTATATADSTTFRARIDSATVTSNLNVNGAFTIGDYGVDYLEISFSEPKDIIRISRDYSINDANFTSYWHTEMDLEDRDFDDAFPDSLVLINGQPEEDTGVPVDDDTRQLAISRARRHTRAPHSRTSLAKNQFNAWGVARSKFELIGPNLVAGWTNIGAARVIVEAKTAVVVKIRNWLINGVQDYPLNDPEVGYSWWETWARITDGVIVWESGLGSASTRTKAQAARALVTLNGTATGTAHGFTHRLIYRQGGLLPAPYRVGTFTGTTTGTFTDTGNDVLVLMRNQKATVGIRTSLPIGLDALSDEAYQSRVFGGYGNHLIWCLPGNPDSFPIASEATVSHQGDNIYRILVWSPSLVIVNRDSVFEMAGSIFEGQDQNWILQRSSSRHGAGARHACIKTPFGILLVNQDGLYMYTPSQGVDEPIEWANERLRPAFEGYGTADPAALDGSRVPAINLSYLRNSVATYRDGKIYLGMPTGNGTEFPNTLFILDMLTKRVWHYSYPWSFRSIMWSRQENGLFFGGADGYIYRGEIGVNDSIGTAGQGVVWGMRSRAWTAPSDTLLENISVERRGGMTVKAIYDGTSTATTSVLTGTGRNWLTPALNGTIANKVEFDFSGTNSDNPATLYNIAWDALSEPVRVQFYRTPHFDNNYKGEKLWDVHYADLAIVDFGTNTETVTGTVTGTVYVDNTAILTNSYICPPTGRQIHPKAFPFDTYGDVGHTVYTCAAGTRFKLWETSYEVRNEPPRITNYQSDIQSLEEQICDAIDIDINPLGTVFSTAFVDNTAVQTATWIGTKRQSYTWALPNELYGRTIHANHVAQGGGLLKHYKTWFHLRPEPDRWQNFVTDKESGDESFFSAVDCDLNCLGNTVLGTAMVDNTAVNTFTFTGTQRQSYVNALAEDTYGRTAWMIYNVSGGARAKHYKTWWHKEAEPDRLTLVQWGPQTFPSSSIIKTWVAELNPLGTATGTIIVEGTAVSTQTFVGTRRQTYNVGLPNITVGGDVDVLYTNATRLKHYSTFLEAEAKPFSKTTWLMTYKKVGGASQLDFARFYELDAEPQSGTATITSIWDIDGVAFQTNTLTFTGREWKTRQPFLPGGRGSIFQQRLSSSQNFRVWHSSMDVYRVGRKGVSFVSITGTPEEPFKLPLELPQPRVD